MKELHLIKKSYLHHAYIIEGERSSVVPKLLIHLENEGIIDLENKPIIDTYDHLNIKDSIFLRGLLNQKTDYSVRIISTDSILFEAQQSLLKLFEEPTVGLHIFLIVSDASSLLPTLKSRAIIIKNNLIDGDIKKIAEKFLSSDVADRLDWVKKTLDKYDTAGDARSYTKNFLTSIALIVRENNLKNESEFLKETLKHISSLSMRGSSPKMLLEYTALNAPRVQG